MSITLTKCLPLIKLRDFQKEKTQIGTKKRRKVVSRVSWSST